MNVALFFKSAVIGAISLVLLVLLQLIYGQVRDRQGRQAEVERNIAESAAGPQTIVGPLLVLKYKERHAVSVVDGKSTSMTSQERERMVLIPAEDLTIEAQATVNEKRRGIFPTSVFTAAHKVSAEFVVPGNWGSAADTTDVVLDRAFLVVALGDSRGVQGLPKVSWAGEAVESRPGTLLPFLAEGFHVPLKLQQGKDLRAQVSMEFELLGVGRLAYVATGKNSHIALNADWPHPSFFGRSLPQAKATGEANFPAVWKVSHLANSAIPQLQAISLPDGRANAHWNADASAFGVAFIDPVNIYLKSERAVKYGILFIGLTFAAFLLFEMLKRLPIHPIQYTLVGLSLAMFFLLLLSLSEQIGFGLAYVAAASACTGLVGFYLAHVMQSVKHAASFSVALALLYGALYGLLQREDNALLLGSALLFVILAITMVVTRKVDWYVLTKKAVAS